MNQNSAEYWFEKGKEYLENEKFNEALEAFEKAIEYNPEDANVWYNKGVTLDKLGRYEEELEAFEKAIEYNPNDADTWYNKGLTLVNLGRYEEALEAFEKAIEYNPKDANTWLFKGFTLGSLGHYEEALEVFNKAIEYNPNDADAWYNKGVTLYKLGRYEEAITSFEQVLRYDHEYLIAYYLQGLSYYRVGNADKEKESYDRMYDAIDSFRDKEISYPPELYAIIYKFDVLLKAIVGDRNTELAGKVISKKREVLESFRGKVPLIKMMEVYLQSARYPEDGEKKGSYLEQAEDIAKEISAYDFLAQVQFEYGVIEESKGDKERAFEDYRDGIKQFESFRQLIPGTIGRGLFMVPFWEMYEHTIRCAIELGQFEEAFRYREMVACRTGLDWLRNAERMFSELTSDELENLNQLMKGLSADVDKLRSSVSSKGSKELFDRIAEGKAERNRLIDKIRKERPAFAHFVSVEPVVNYKDIDLSEDEVIVEYFLERLSKDKENVRYRVHIWALSYDTGVNYAVSNKELVLPIGVKELKKRLNDWNFDEWKKNSKDWYTCLIKPVEGYLAGKKVIYTVPYHELHFIPFSDLYDGEHFLSDRYITSHLPSASMINLLKRAKKKESNYFLGIVKEKYVSKPNFEGAEEFVKGLAAKYFPDRNRVLGEGNNYKDSIKTELESVKQKEVDMHLYICAHGKVGDSVLNSSFIVSGEESDTHLSIGEIVELGRIGCDTVFLQSCRTGEMEAIGNIGIGHSQESSMYAGDDLLGFINAFFLLGASSVIAPAGMFVWKEEIGDRIFQSGSMIVESFYKYRLAEKLSGSEALARAKVDVRNEGKEKGTRLIRYWIPYTHFGIVPYRVRSRKSFNPLSIFSSFFVILGISLVTVGMLSGLTGLSTAGFISSGIGVLGFIFSRYIIKSA